ncbi:MAG: hypothetical protein AB7U05_04495 [Mangrovibacterium sp.]
MVTERLLGPKPKGHVVFDPLKGAVNRGIYEPDTYTRNVSKNFMTTSEQLEIYNNFLVRLEYFKNEKLIKILDRGVSKKFAYKRVNLDPRFNSLDKFSEMLFYYGEKSKYFWEQRLGRKFSINDTGEETFGYIFEKFKEISDNIDCNKGTINYRTRNKKAFEYFNDLQNLKSFIETIDLMDEKIKKQLKNYYFRIIHQLGETDYKKSSLNISGTTNEEVARQFSNDEIIINFWDFDFNQFDPQVEDIPLFIGKPYKNQDEISVFGVIFPHYIHSFKYENQYFYNPALFKGTDFDNMILGGFDIDQTGFESKFKFDTSYEMGLMDNGKEQNEINKVE